jgi:hypothetical protein
MLDMFSCDFNLSSCGRAEVRNLLAEVGARPALASGNVYFDPVGAEVVLADAIPLSFESHLVERLCAIIRDERNLEQALPWSRKGAEGQREIPS